MLVIYLQLFIMQVTHFGVVLKDYCLEGNITYDTVGKNVN